MSVVNSGQYVLASTRVSAIQRTLLSKIADMELEAMSPVDPEALVDLAERIHAQSIDLLEQCEELAKTINPSWSRK